MATAITDKQRFAALLYFYVREQMETDRTFSVNDTFGSNMYKVLKADYSPTPAQMKKILKLFPALEGMRDEHGKLTAKGAKAFATLLEMKNAYIRGGGAGKGRQAPDILLKPVVAKEKSKDSDFTMGLELGVLAMKCSNRADWLAVLEHAERAKMPLSVIVSGLKAAMVVARG